MPPMKKKKTMVKAIKDFVTAGEKKTALKVPKIMLKSPPCKPKKRRAPKKRAPSTPQHQGAGSSGSHDPTLIDEK